MDFEIVRAEQVDHNFLLQLRLSTMVEHLEQAGIFLTQDEHLTRLNDDFDCYHLVIHQNERVGALKYREMSDKFEIMQIQISPAHQGYGLGKMVLNQVIAWSVNRGKPIFLTVLKANPARELYLRLGFTIVGEDKDEFHMLRQPSS